MYNIKFDGTTYVAIFAVPPVTEVLHKYTHKPLSDVHIRNAEYDVRLYGRMNECPQYVHVLLFFSLISLAFFPISTRLG